jgi:predicted ribosome quality control (RQC) complex YloA/Tae2 family protein
VKKEDCEYVKEHVYKYIAPQHLGVVCLHDVYRLFSNYGSPRELEKCLDSFVKEGVAEKLEEEGGGKVYVFKDIVEKFREALVEKLEDLEAQKKRLLNQKAEREREVEVLYELYNLWLSGWSEEDQIVVGVKNYAADFWLSAIREDLKTIRDLEDKLVSIERKIKRIKRTLGM